MKLNIGGGDAKIPGFTNIDRKQGQEAYPLPHESGSVDEIRASHILEHFGFEDALDALREWHRVLRPGGRIMVAVPDAELCVSLQDSDPKWMHYLMGGQTDENDFHKSAWSRDRLREYLMCAGFADIKDWQSDGLDTSGHPVSLNLEARKAPDAGASGDEAGEYQDIKIAAVMSIPRIGWNDSWLSIVDALRPWNIPLRTFNGVFWGQCMQRVMREAVEDGVDWILTIDYDSLFNRHHLDKMIGIFGSNPDIDALCPLQPKRGCGTALCTADGQTQLDVTGPTAKISTGHFGLTLIRADALRDIPLPWFASKTADDGTWTGDKWDEDIWFWKRWAEHGKSLHLATEVSIAHLELMCAEIQRDGTTKHMHVKTWRERNK